MSSLQAVKIEGGVIPSSLFYQLQHDSLGTVESRSPASYHLTGGEKVRDAANRSWNYLGTKFQAWVTQQENEARGFDSTVAKTAREMWILPLLQELGFGRVPATKPIAVEESAYPVSHLWQHVPMHIVGPGIDLDKRHVGIVGAERAPQAMVQELLNRSDDYLWAILTNGKKLRLLRDSTALAGSSYIEFDLHAIFSGELFAEFSLLWQLTHVSRFEERASAEGTLTVTESWLEKWRIAAIDEGSRALRTLSVQVESAIEALGRGFIEHRDNTALREMLQNGVLSSAEYNRHLLRLIYRFLFLFVAEDRDALLVPEASPEARSRYEDYYSTKRLRNVARKRAGSGAYDDLWHAQSLILKNLGGDGIPELGLSALGGLFDADPLIGDPLLKCKLANESLLTAIRKLAWIQNNGKRTVAVDYKNLGAEELGSVYESLLELVPSVDVAGHNFMLDHVSGNDRKTSGSYYTPSSLVEALLDSSLDPILDEALHGKDAEQAEAALLDLKIVDPACGSGHFLVAAARRIASRIASLRSGEEEPTPTAVRHALRDVVGTCIYGVDLNPMAAELAKVSLWLEAMEPGKALGFLDARIRVGNSLIGTTPALMRGGLPDSAFNALEGDGAAAVKAAKARNKKEVAKYGGQQGLLDFDFGEVAADETLAKARAEFLQQNDDAQSVRDLGSRFREYENSSEYRNPKIAADAWCAAFMWHHQKVDAAGMAAAEASTNLTAVSVLPALTSATVREFETNPQSSGLELTRKEVERLANEFRFFHWHIEFPEVFFRGDEKGEQGWAGGFDCVLGNPPWENIELKEQEFFAASAPNIAKSAGAKRKAMVEALQEQDEILYRKYTGAKRKIDALRKYTSNSGLFPLTGRGRVKTDAVLTELGRMVLRTTGALGLVVPTAIATDDTTKYFFKDLVESKTLVVLFDFENRKPLFDGVDSRTKFCILGISGRARHTEQASFAFFLHHPQQIEGSKFAMTSEEITLLNPNTGTVPIFRTHRDAEITLDIYRRVPVLIDENDPKNGNPWGVSFKQGLFNMTSDSHLFHTRDQLESDGWTLNGNVFEKTTSDQLHRMLPLYQGIMIGSYDHRAADVVKSATAQKRQNQPSYLTELDKDDASRAVIPAYWVSEHNMPQLNTNLLLGFPSVTSPTNSRTMYSTLFPAVGVGHSISLVVCQELILLNAVFSSFMFDYLLRQKIGGVNLSFMYLNQLPVPSQEILEIGMPGGHIGWLKERVLELSYTARDMKPLAALVGDHGEPFRFDIERRAHIRAEIDAAIFRVYGASREDVVYILDSFTSLSGKEQSEFGEYRTKSSILEVYDRMQEAIDSGVPYTSTLNPPPGQGPRHPARIGEETP